MAAFARQACVRMARWRAWLYTNARTTHAVGLTRLAGSAFIDQPEGSLDARERKSDFWSELRVVAVSLYGGLLSNRIISCSYLPGGARADQSGTTLSV